jgi:hypothetical protein
MCTGEVSRPHTTACWPFSHGVCVAPYIVGSVCFNVYLAYTDTCGQMTFDGALSECVDS